MNELVWLLIFDELCAQEEEFKKLLKEKELTNKKSHLLTLTLISVYIVDVRKKKSRTWRVHDSHLNIYLQKQIQKTRFYNLKLLYVLEVGVIYFLLLIRVHTHTNTDEKSIKKSKDLCLFFVFYFERKFINTVRLLILTTLPLCVQSKWWLLFKKTQRRSKIIYTNEFLETHTHTLMSTIQNLLFKEIENETKIWW